MLKIEKWTENKILRTVSLKIKDNEIKNYLKLAREMKKFIKDPKNWWVWLAAPQIWHNIRLIIVSLLNNREDENYKTIIMFNPVILEFSDECELWEEWCLSVPNKKWDVKRSKEIKFAYQDEKWSLKTLLLSWLKARIVQHEVDHLDWVLFIDRIKKETI